MKERRHLARFYHAAMFGCHAWNLFTIFTAERRWKKELLFTVESCLIDPTDVNDFRNRRVLIDLQEKTPSISFYIAKEDAYIASLTGIIKSNRTKFLLIVPNKRVMKVSKLFLYGVVYKVLKTFLICVVCRLSKISFTINHLPMHKIFFMHSYI